MTSLLLLGILISLEWRSIMGDDKEIEVVKGLDVQKYMGRWYEIATIPSFFQPKNGENTRATYTLKPNGEIQVLNEVWSNGKRESIQGIAYKADPNSDEAKLKVKFYVPPFFPLIPVAGDYWVLSIDEAYNNALVGSSSRNNFWVLCRQTRMDDATYNQLLNKAKQRGYDVTKLRKTPQAEPPP